MIHIKSDSEIKKMKKGGKILAEVIKKVFSQASKGKTLAELDDFAERLIREKGGQSSFKMVEGYRWTICSCVNEAVVHGVPDDYQLKDNDILGIDCGVFYQGFHTDAAWTVRLGSNQRNKKDKIYNFLKTGEKALKKAIKEVKPGNYIYDISSVIEKSIQEKRYSIVKSLVGHGVGKNLHESPEVPGFIRGKRKSSPRIEKGMVLAIEIIYNIGGPEVVYRDDDQWTIVTKDGKISGLFEATVAATNHGCIVLTPILDIGKNYD